MSESHDHHFIPKFFIEAFKGSNDKYFMYNKKYDHIKHLNSAKGAFYEVDRNTTSLEYSTGSTVLEDKYYRRIDNDSAPVFAKLNKGLPTLQLVEEHVGHVRLFILSLILRIPSYDEIIDNMIKTANFGVIDNDSKLEVLDEIEKKTELEIHLQNPSFIKMQRMNLLDMVIKENIRRIRGKAFNHGVLKGNNYSLLLGDLPTLYLNDPTSINNMMSETLILPISHDRIFCDNVSQSFRFSEHKALDLNALIIAQSTQYIIGSNKEVLEKSVAHYKNLKKARLLGFVRKNIFLTGY